MIANRLADWVTALYAREPHYDLVAVAVVWGLAVWGISCWAAWVQRRHALSLVAVAPPGVVLATVLAYTRGPSNILLIFLGAFLLLLVFTHHWARERRWSLTGVDFPAENELTTASVGVLLTAGLLVLAAEAPSISLQQVIDFAQRYAQVQSDSPDALGLSVGLSRADQDESVLDEARYGGLPRSHLLGSGPELKERVVMVIQVQDLAGAHVETS